MEGGWKEEEGGRKEGEEVIHFFRTLFLKDF
jgi:hypothetical protein